MNEAGAARERITRLLVIEIFLVFFLGWMIAPLLPRLAFNLGTNVEHAGVLIPAYAIPYGCICLLIGPLADRFGRGRVLKLLLIPTVVLPALSATAHSIGQLIAWRVITGIALGGIAPIALALIAEMYPYAERGRPVGWIFGAIAGGMALGATTGPWLEPWIGWRGLFLLVSAINVFAGVTLSREVAKRADVAGSSLQPVAVIGNYVALLTSKRGATVYGYVFLNGAFHSGIFSWLGVYFTARYHLGSTRLGFAMLGYGIPGFLLGPIVGRYADRFGRRWLIRAGLVIAAVCAFVLTRDLPLVLATLTITALSFGFDLSHPLFSGIVSALDPIRTAQAMALNTFMVFVGMGVGSMIFASLYGAYAMNGALTIFGIFQLSIAAATIFLFDDSWR